MDGHIETRDICQSRIWTNGKAAVVPSGGLGVPEAARPTSSILAKAYAEVTKTFHMPLRPLANAPGSSHIDSVLCVLAWSSGVITGVVVKLEDAQREREYKMQRPVS